MRRGDGARNYGDGGYGGKAATEEEGTVAAGPDWTTDSIRNATATTGTAADPAVRTEQDSR